MVGQNTDFPNDCYLPQSRKLSPDYFLDWTPLNPCLDGIAVVVSN